MYQASPREAPKAPTKALLHIEQATSHSTSYCTFTTLPCARGKIPKKRKLMEAEHQRKSKKISGGRREHLCKSREISEYKWKLIKSMEAGAKIDANQRRSMEHKRTMKISGGRHEHLCKSMNINVNQRESTNVYVEIDANPDEIMNIYENLRK